jgi:hypothetical protein
MKPVRHKEAKSEQAKLVVDEASLVSEPSPDAREETAEERAKETKEKTQDPAIGRIIAGQYELLERIGEGGMSTVIELSIWP